MTATLDADTYATPPAVASVATPSVADGSCLHSDTRAPSPPQKSASLCEATEAARSKRLDRLVLSTPRRAVIE